MNHPERQDNQESGQWNNYKNAQSQRKIRKENTSVCETMLIYLHGPSTKDDLDASFLISKNIKFPQLPPKGSKHNDVLQQCSLIIPHGCVEIATQY